MYPQAKDLYDAVFLAERTPLGYDLLRHADHPDLSADGQDLVQRLALALEATFVSGPPPL